MNRHRATSSTVASGSQPPVAPRLGSPAFVLFTAITALLPLIASQLNTGFGLIGFEGPQALLAVGLLILVTFTLALSEAARRRELLLPRTGLLIAVALLAVAAVVSAIFAANRYEALLGATSIVLGVIYFATALLVTNTPARARWLVCVLVAAVLATAAVSLLGRLEVPPAALLEYFETNRAAILAERGIAPGSAEEELYRIRIAEDFPGTFFHANLMATCMAVGLLVTLGLLLARLRPRDAADRSARLLAAALLALAVAAEALALGMTKSRAGIIGAAAGLYLILVLGRVRRTAWRVVLLGLPAVGAAVLIPLAFVENWFPRAMSSLHFRWDYWQASWGVIRDQPWLGVGPDNFGDAYLAHKLATAPEEIRNPHNVFVWAWTELGPLGLAAIVLLLIFTLRAARRAGEGVPRLRCLQPCSSATDPLSRRALAWLLFVLGLLYSFFELAKSGPLEWQSLAVLLPVVLGLALFALAFVATMILWPADAPNDAGPAAPWLRYGLLAALLVFWLQNLVSIDFAQLPMVALSYALLAALLALGNGALPIRWALATAPRRFLAVALPLVAIVGYVAFIQLPITRGVNDIADAFQHDPASAAYRQDLARAAEDCPFWDEPHVRLAENDWLQAEADGNTGPAERRARLEVCLRELERAIALNPRTVESRRRAAQVCLALADLTRAVRSPNVADAAESWAQVAIRYQGEAVALYPTKASFRAELATMLARAGRAAEARAEARKALDLDAVMPDQRRKLDARTRAACETLAADQPAP